MSSAVAAAEKGALVQKAGGEHEDARMGTIVGEKSGRVGLLLPQVLVVAKEPLDKG